MIERNMAKIKHKILVLSGTSHCCMYAPSATHWLLVGKGGVGKSTTCCNIAQCFVAQGLKVTIPSTVHATHDDAVRSGCLISISVDLQSPCYSDWRTGK